MKIEKIMKPSYKVGDKEFPTEKEAKKYILGLEVQEWFENYFSEWTIEDSHWRLYVSLFLIPESRLCSMIEVHFQYEKNHRNLKFCIGERCEENVIDSCNIDSVDEAKEFVNQTFDLFNNKFKL